MTTQEALKMASLFMAKESLTVKERQQLLQACKEALASESELSSNPLQLDEPVAWIKQGMDGYPKLVFNGKFEYESISAKWDDIALYTKEQI